jgi:hypothetical protein
MEQSIFKMESGESPSTTITDGMSDDGETPMNFTVFGIVSNLSKGIKLIKMRALEAEANTQAVTSLLDDANLTRNEIARKNEIAQGGNSKFQFWSFFEIFP